MPRFVPCWALKALTSLIALSMAEVVSGAALRRLQLRPGDVQHGLAEAAGVRRKLGDVEDGRRAVVVEPDDAHIHKPGLSRLAAVTG